MGRDSCGQKKKDRWWRSFGVFCPVSILTGSEKLRARDFGGDVEWNEVVAGAEEGKDLTAMSIKSNLARLACILQIYT
jgi:hypothetical protein